jgi:MFS family permease
MQDIICKDVHQVDIPGLLPEEDCRDHAVQHRLNSIIMGMQISATISGTIPHMCSHFYVLEASGTNTGTATMVALPLGVIADRIGRLPILAASILSMLLSQAYAMFICWKSKIIPLEAIWGIGVPLLLGGGRSVAEAMVFAIIADTVPDQKRQVDCIPSARNTMC